MSVRVVDVDLRGLKMSTRMPFRYGIAELRSLTHLLVRATCEIDGQIETGLAADGLAPKWFTKNPQSSVEDDLREMLEVICTAAKLAKEIGPRKTVFEWWQALYEAQKSAVVPGTPPLLANFGVSLMERAVIEAYCRKHRLTFAKAIRTNAFGIELGLMHPELTGAMPGDLLPAEPRRRILVRHTVGLSDPLTDADILPAERVDDGLPQSLEANIREYGLTHFKIKLNNEPQENIARLRDLRRVIEANVPGDYFFTLDGNEQFTTIAAFRQQWQAIVSEPSLTQFLRYLIFVEQPIHRHQALNDETRTAMLAWVDRPPTIIDESDGEVDSIRRALDYGYVGTSHKNCKGIFKGVANACLVRHLRTTHPDTRYELSGEDLSNVGPVALLQDLAVCATLGLEHIERNSQQYFRGLSMWPADIQSATTTAHGDLYRRHERGFETLRIRQGGISVGSAVEAPFGVAFSLAIDRFEPLTA